MLYLKNIVDRIAPQKNNYVWNQTNERPRMSGPYFYRQIPMSISGAASLRTSRLDTCFVRQGNAVAFVGRRPIGWNLPRRLLLCFCCISVLSLSGWHTSTYTLLPPQTRTLNLTLTLTPNACLVAVLGSNLGRGALGQSIGLKNSR